MILFCETYRIRQLDDPEPDFFPLLAVYKQCEDFLALGPIPTASLAMIKADLDLSHNTGGIFCAVENEHGQVVGVFDFIPSGYHGNPQLAYLSLLMIAAPWRGKGLGERLVGSVEKYICSAAPIRAIAAGVQINNPGAIKFWQRMGYRIVSEPIHQSDGTITYDLLKEIRTSP